MLPDFRGPAPLFWQLRAGLQTSGVTLHWMDGQYDHGAIIAQSLLSYPDGATATEIDTAYAELGAALLNPFFVELAQGVRVRDLARWREPTILARSTRLYT
ncbi:MAG: formyltransferase family protein [Caldilineaceae bacterium]